MYGVCSYGQYRPGPALFLSPPPLQPVSRACSTSPSRRGSACFCHMALNSSCSNKAGLPRWFLMSLLFAARFGKKINNQDLEVQQRNKYPNWAEEQRKKAAELARVRAIREKKMDRNKKEVREARTSEAAFRVALSRKRVVGSGARRRCWPLHEHRRSLTVQEEVGPIASYFGFVS